MLGPRRGGVRSLASMLLLFACAAAGGPAGCGGRIGAAGGAGDDGAGGAGGDDGGSGDDAGMGDDGATSPGQPATACPATLPSATASCSPLGITCEYGTDPLPDCDTLATCLVTRWSIQAPTCTPAPQPPGGCPAAASGIPVGATCTPAGAECDFADGTKCGCTLSPSGEGPATWGCAAPPSPPCPAVRPRIGAPCTVPKEQVCTYGNCLTTMVQIACVRGTWGDPSTPICF
jgi:hypothetical protein